jgi:hypothetical protein
VLGARATWLGVALALLAAGALVGAIERPSLPWSSPSRTEDVRAAVDWPDGCESVTIDRPLEGDGRVWRHTEDAALIQCRTLGPALIYARFDSVAHRDQELALRPPPDEAYCVIGREVVLDSLFGGFAQVCRRLGGRLVRAPATGPRIPPDHGPYRVAGPVVTAAPDGMFAVTVRVNRRLPRRPDGHPEAQLRVDGDYGYGWLREVSAGQRCYRQLAEQPLSGPAIRAGDRVRLTLVVDGTPRGAVTMRATFDPVRSASGAGDALRHLGC